MKKTIRLVELILVGNRKDYSIKFRKGFNCISGNTSTGKTSIFEMIDYALGSAEHKSYIEIGNTCSDVNLILYVGEELLKIKRTLFDFKAPIIVESWDENNNKFLFYGNYEIDSPKNKRSFAAFLIEKIGLADITIKGQTLSSRDILKYCYLRQTDIDNENILGEKRWEINIKRKAVFEIIFNIFNEGLEETKKIYDERKKELDSLLLKLAGIKDFVRELDVKDTAECCRYKEQLHAEISEAKKEIATLKKGGVTETDETLKLKIGIESLRNSINGYQQIITEQTQYIQKLSMLINQYTSEVNKKRLAVQGYQAFNEYEFLYCPNCLMPIEKNNDISSCYLCGREKTDNADEIIVLKSEIRSLSRKITELSKHITGEKEKLVIIDNSISDKVKLLKEKEFLLNHLSNNFVNTNIERIEHLNYDIGTKYHLIQKADENLKMFEEITRQEKIISDKREALLLLKNNIKAYKEEATDRDELFKKLSQIFSEILENFKYPKLSGAYIDSKDYLPYVRGRKYDDIGSSGGVTIITMAYYLTILLLGINDHFVHPGLLMIDSPRKNLGADNKDSDHEFKDEEIFRSIMRTLYSVAEARKDSLQLIIINNGYPEFIPSECVIAEFDADGRNGLKKGLIDDVE